MNVYVFMLYITKTTGFSFKTFYLQIIIYNFKIVAVLRKMYWS